MEKYTVVKRLNAGTHGSAYLVTLKTNPNQQLVLKKIKIEPGNDAIYNEVKLLRMLSYPLVLRYARAHTADF